MAESTVHSYAKKRLEIMKIQGKCVFYHVPNGLKRGKKAAAMLRNMGARAGVADFALVLKGGRAAFLELKDENGSQSDAQIEFQKECERLGALYRVASTPDEVNQILREWEGDAA